MGGFIFSWIVLALLFVPAHTATVQPAQMPVAIVFGAGLAPNHQPSIVLQDRLDTAYELYSKGLVRSVFVSGDSTTQYHDEVGVMSDYLIQKGIPKDKIRSDGQGIDTYTTCLHAKDTGDTEFTLVTQSFHMPRAVYLCEGVGLTVTQAVADKREYDPSYAQREKEAMAKAWLQLNTNLSPESLDTLEESIKQ